MTEDLGEIGALFQRLVEDPASVGAFEEYARAVEAAVRHTPQAEAPRLARTLAEHLETLPDLAESRLESSIDTVSRELLSSLELEELRSAKQLASAYERARGRLEARHPRIDGRSPEEFVSLYRTQPLRILDHLETAEADWLRPHLQRCRALVRRTMDVPGDPEADASLAAALADLGGRLEPVPPHALAEVAYRAALLYDPGQARARAGLGELALRFGRLREAELELRAALDRDATDARALAGLAELFLESGRLDAARPLVQRLLEAHSGGAAARLLAGSIALYEGRLTEALEHGLEAVSRDPDHPRAFVLLADAYARAGFPELAAQHRAAAGRRLSPGSEPPALAAGPRQALELPARLLVPPPPPPTHEADPATPQELAPLGPLTRREAFTCLLRKLRAGDRLEAEGMGLVLRARGVLRIPREEFLALYDRVRAEDPPHPALSFDPVEFFEELRRQAWRDGVLSPPERQILEDILGLLGIDRRGSPRPRGD